MQDYLFECLQSLSKQTLQNFEVILINDGSVDHSSDIINNFVSSDVRFHVYETTHVGQSRARKIGLDHSKGKYLAFLDSDDVVASQWLATLVDDLISSNADMSAVGFDLLFVKRNGKRKFVQMNTKGSFSIIEGKDVLKAWMSCDAIGGFLWNKMFKKELFCHIKFAHTDYMEDIFLINQIIVKVHILSYRAASLYHYRQRANSSVNRSFKKSDLESLDYVYTMIRLAEDDEEMKPLAFSRYAKTTMSIINKMKKRDIVLNNQEIQKILDNLYVHRKYLQLKNPIDNLILLTMLKTRRIYILSRLEKGLINFKYYLKLIGGD